MLRTDPEVVVLAPCGTPSVDALAQADELVPAELLRRRVVAVDLARPGPRLVDCVEALASVLHPDAGLPSRPDVVLRALTARTRSRPPDASIRGVLRHFRAVVVAAILLVVLVACTLAEVETPDPAAVPSGEPVALGGDPTGPVTLLGSGESSDGGWRYVIYESDDGWCTELQMSEVTSTGCGPDLLPPDGESIGSAGALPPLESGVTPVEGVVSNDIVTVMIIDEEKGRLPANLMPLDDAGLEGKAFVGFMPADGTPTHIQAVALSGEILQTYELP